VKNSEDIFTGLLIGPAVGDALGLPAENLKPERIRRLWSGQWRMRFLFGRGMISDDTEHTLMVAQALLSHSDDVAAFQKSLAWKFRWWFASLPGGMGLTTAKACLRLWAGIPTSRSSVISAGCGPSMRSAIIGAFFANEPDKRRSFAQASSSLTHRGWQAATAALAVAECAAFLVSNGSRPNASEIIDRLSCLTNEPDWQKPIAQIRCCLGSGASVSDFARLLGLRDGVSGYSLHVVPVAIYAWLRHPDDFRKAVVSVLECGGDTDTVGAIVGALAGAAVGEQGIPREWSGRLLEWPRSPALIREIARRLARQRLEGGPSGALSYFWPGVILRNALFLIVVLLHGLRRLAPPY
jgi:ADP-ribosyl-[dinitrogen reductase] hydrolase